MIYLTMILFVKDGKEDIFHQFEELAIPLLKDYKGKLIYRLKPTKESYISHEDELPYEIHFLSFESEEDFLNFAKDERRKEFYILKMSLFNRVFSLKERHCHN